MLVCRPEPESVSSKVMFAVPSMLFSLVALCVSILAYRYNLSKDQVARMQSVNDDFWLRKVVSPASIEPFVAFGTALFSNLPPVAAEDAQAEDDALAAELQKLRNLSVAFGNLKVVNDTLAIEVREHVDRLEDKLVTYRFDRKQFHEGKGPEPSRQATLEDIAGIQHDVLLTVKRHQSTLFVRRKGWLARFRGQGKRTG